MRFVLVTLVLVTAVQVRAAEPADQSASAEDKFIGLRNKYWAFQPVIRPAPPAVSAPWVHTTIDAFILGALRAKNLTPSQPASRAKLIRRLTFDLIGLPPTPEEVDAFVR